LKLDFDPDDPFRSQATIRHTDATGSRTGLDRCRNALLAAGFASDPVREAGNGKAQPEIKMEAWAVSFRGCF
jgi:hypothetical protein